MYEIIKDKDNTVVVSKNSNGMWFERDFENLKKDGVYFSGGSIAVLKEERLNNNPLLTVGIEDDGRISFGNSNLHIDSRWGKDLIRNVSDAIGGAL